MPNLGQLSVASIQLPVILTGPHSTDHSIRISGGADRDRTGDPLVANQVLSQLSYSPFLVASRQYPVASYFSDHWPLTTDLVGLGRVELPTSPLSGVRSSQLSYRPIQLSVASIQLPVVF